MDGLFQEGGVPVIVKGGLCNAHEKYGSKPTLGTLLERETEN
jgi:hypothetical protein